MHLGFCTVFPPSWWEEADSPHLSSEEKFWPITRSQLETANVGMRWQNLFLELQETLLSQRRAAPESLLSGGGWQLLTAPGGGGEGASEASGCLDICAQNSPFSFTRVQALNKLQCGASPRTIILEKPGVENAQGEAVGCSRQGNGLEIQAPTHPFLSCLPLLGHMTEPPRPVKWDAVRESSRLCKFRGCDDKEGRGHQPALLLGTTAGLGPMECL